MSYRRAWEYIHDLEASLHFAVVETRIGGAHGGGARLSPRGAALLDRYLAIHGRVAAAIAVQGGVSV